MQLPISLGNQGFASLRENHCFYIDKTDFIREWWEEQICHFGFAFEGKHVLIG